LLDNGRVIEGGTVGELLSAGGRFNEFWRNSTTPPNGASSPTDLRRTTAALAVCLTVDSSVDRLMLEAYP